MPLDQAWAVGGGAENSVEGARLATYLATKGGRGVILPSDMKVSALPVPGAAVRIVSGACASPNDYLNEGDSQDGGGQSYGGREISSTDFPVAPTGSAGGQVKYLIWAVHDEQYEGDEPADPVNDLRNGYEWVSTLNGITYPHVQLVKLDQPKNTATITNSMLTDIRELADPKTDIATYSRPRLAADDDPRQNYCNSRYSGANGDWYGEYFPGGDGSPSAAYIDIPWWATQMAIRADWVAVRAESGKNAHGRRWIEYGDEYRAHGWPGGRQLQYATQQFAFDTTGTQGSYRADWAVIDQVPIPKKLRGKRIQFAFKAGLSPDADTNGVYMNGLSGLGMQIIFANQAIDENTL